MSTQPKRGQTVSLEGHTMTLADRAPWTGGWWAQDETGAMWGLTARTGRFTAMYPPETVSTMTRRVTGYADRHYRINSGWSLWDWTRIVTDAARHELERAA